MAFYPNQNIFQPSSGSETYTISTTQNNTQYQKTMSECIDLIRTKVPGANLIILKRDSGLRGYYIGGAVISENIFYIGDTAEYPGNMTHHVYFGNGSNTGTIQIRYYTVYYRTGARLDDNPMQTDTYQVEQIGEIGNCFWTNPGGNDLGNVVYVSGGYSQLVINDGPPVLYQWSSVPAISGKNGILSLSQIKDENIGDGSTVTGAPRNYVEGFATSSKISTYLAQMSVDQTIDLMYSGDVYKCTLTKNIYGSFGTLRFYLQPGTPGTVPSSFYSFDIQGNWIDSYLGFIIDDENEVAALNMIRPYIDNGQELVDFCNPGTAMTAEDMHLMWGWIRGSFVIDQDPFVDNEGDGGGDVVDRINNPIPEPGVPSLSAYDSGFMSQYKIEKTELQKLAKFLWSDAFVDNVKKFFEDPMQIIMGLTIFPFTPYGTSVGTFPIRAGGISTGAAGYKLSTQFHKYPMGKANIEKRLRLEDGTSGGVYFDYSPYTEIKINLPYCGEHSLDPDDIIGKTVELSYSVDHVTGVCVAHLTIKDIDSENSIKECHYNFSGQMGIQIPVSQADFSGIYRGLLSAGISIGTAAATIATGGLTAPMAAAAAKKAGVDPGTREFQSGNAVALGSGTASRLANNVSNMHPVVQHTSGGGSLSGSLASEYPYITISEPDVFQAENQPHYKGYPINATHKIGEFSGYVQVESVHLDGLSCTESEREQIASMLANGVIVNKENPSSEPDSSAPAGEFAIVFLKNKSDPETIGKYWDGELKITGKLLYSQDINHLRVRVKGNFSAYNYAFVKAFNRYYYINTFEIETGDLMIVDMSSDPLQSFKSEILEVPALIDSAEDKDKAKFLMNNGFWYMKQNKMVKTITFKDENGYDVKFDRSSTTGTECFLLTIAGDSSGWD